MDSVIQWCPLPVLAKSWKEKESEKENGEVKKTTKDVGQSDSLTVLASAGMIFRHSL
jgi:hypothetical protein